MLGIFFGTLGSIFSSACLVFRKKAIDINKNSWVLLLLSRLFCSLFLASLFLLTGFVKIDVFLKTNVFLFVILSGVFNILKGPLEKKIYKEEKLSVLAPYENVSDIIIIVFSFLYFGDASLTSFLIAIVAVSIVILSSIDYKNFSLPRNFGAIILSKFLVAGWIIMNGLGLKLVSPMEFFVLANVFMFIMVLVLSVFRKEIKYLPENKKSFYKNMWLSALFGEAAEFVGYIVIDGFGLILSTLLAFLTIVITMCLSFFVFKDKPDKKDVFVAITVTFLIGLGFYFK